MEQIIKRYEGTRLGAQEIMGHVLHDDTGFLWQQCFIQYGCEDGDDGSSLEPVLAKVGRGQAN